MNETSPILEVRELRKAYAAHGAIHTAVNGVSLSVRCGETLGIVGESGCGKTTLARMLMRLVEPDSGEIVVDGQDWLAARGGEFRRLRRTIQMVFQDPMASLNPRHRVGGIVGEPLEIHESSLSGSERRQRVMEMLAEVGMPEDSASRYPHEFSGGQRQRIGIARALILRPKIVVADEPVSALDVSIGAQILELLVRLQAEFSLTMILISHSLPVVAQMAARVAVMQNGQFVEVGETEQVLQAPQNEYTRALVAAVPEIPA
jgi:ABC-type glutathione transport system ATPase component